MSRLTIRLLIFFLLPLMPLLTVSAQSDKAAGGTQGKDAEFSSLIEQYYAAWNTGNPDNAAPLYAKDPGLVFYDITPLKYNGWDEYREGVKKVFRQFSSLKITPHEDLRVTRRGNLAWTTVTFHLSGVPKAGGAMELDGRHTVIWEKRRGKWLIVHEHFSAPLPG